MGHEQTDLGDRTHVPYPSYNCGEFLRRQGSSSPALLIGLIREACQPIACGSRTSESAHRPPRLPVEDALSCPQKDGQTLRNPGKDALAQTKIVREILYQS